MGRPLCSTVSAVMRGCSLYTLRLLTAEMVISRNGKVQFVPPRPLDLNRRRQATGPEICPELARRIKIIVSLR